MSHFVSAGTNEEPTERDGAWLKAQQELEAKHKEKVKIDEQKDGKSLFETLQANKAAKEEAFAESTRLKNQFRSLDEDEIDFLDAVLESERAKDAETRKQMTEQLDAFRRQQEEAEKAAKLDEAAAQPEGTELWSVGPRKRKKGREKEGLGGLKLRKTSTSEGTDSSPPAAAARSESETMSAKDLATVKPIFEHDDSAEGRPQGVKGPSPVTATSASPPVAALGLAGYSSDEG